MNTKKWITWSCLKTYYFPLRSILDYLLLDSDQLQINPIKLPRPKTMCVGEIHLMTVAVCTTLTKCCVRILFSLLDLSSRLDDPLMKLPQIDGWPPQRTLSKFGNFSFHFKRYKKPRRTCSCSSPRRAHGPWRGPAACGSVGGCRQRDGCLFLTCLGRHRIIVGEQQVW